MLSLLVGIDTEGDNQWDAAARANQTFENIYALPRLHALFARHGVRPTYLITYPVATDPRSADVLRELLAGGDCEIGAHHHAWETPPCTAEDVRAAPVRARRCRATQFERAARVADRRDRRRRSAQRPVSYRSGRFGFSADHVVGARAAGLPGRVERRAAVLRGAQGRAGLRRGAARARTSSRTTTRRGRARSNLLEVPVSAALNRRLPARLQYALRARAAAVHDQADPAEAAAVARMRWLRPSYSSLDDMMRARAPPRRPTASRCST